MRLWFWVVVFAVLTSCALGPTTVSESDLSVLERSFQFERMNRPVKFTADTVVFDVRSFFDYQIASLPGAIHLDYKEFSPHFFFEQDFQEKATTLARRLALKGITPFSHIVVMGYGVKGKGEEGDVGLTLLALGIERIQLVSEAAVKSQFVTKKRAPHANQRYWEPRVVGALFCSPHVRNDSGFVLNVDKKDKQYAGFTQRLASVNTDWIQFVNRDDFSPNYSVKKVLAKQDINESSPIMVRGHHAALVTFNLVQLGYHQACMMNNE